MELAVLLLDLWHQKPLQQWSARTKVIPTSGNAHRGNGTIHRLTESYLCTGKLSHLAWSYVMSPISQLKAPFRTLLCEKVVRPLKNSSQSGG